MLQTLPRDGPEGNLFLEMSITAPIGLPIQIRIQAFDGSTGLFPQAKIYDPAGSLVTTLNLTHIAGGLYGAPWTPAVEGLFTAVGQFFTDSGHTTDAGLNRTVEDVDVSTLKSNVARLLGLSQEFVVIDSQTYDGLQNLTSARIRIYDSKAHALAAGMTGLIATYTQTATYSGILLQGYTVVKEP
jgi:hypothetical protein